MPALCAPVRSPGAFLQPEWPDHLQGDCCSASQHRMQFSIPAVPTAHMHHVPVIFTLLIPCCAGRLKRWERGRVGGVLILQTHARRRRRRRSMNVRMATTSTSTSRPNKKVRSRCTKRWATRWMRSPSPCKTGSCLLVGVRRLHGSGPMEPSGSAGDAGMCPRFWNCRFNAARNAARLRARARGCMGSSPSGPGGSGTC